MAAAAAAGTASSPVQQALLAAVEPYANSTSARNFSVAFASNVLGSTTLRCVAYGLNLETPVSGDATGDSATWGDVHLRVTTNRTTLAILRAVGAGQTTPFPDPSALGGVNAYLLGLLEAAGLSVTIDVRSARSRAPSAPCASVSYAASHAAWMRSARRRGAQFAVLPAAVASSSDENQKLLYALTGLATPYDCVASRALAAPLLAPSPLRLLTPALPAAYRLVGPTPSAVHVPVLDRIFTWTAPFRKDTWGVIIASIVVSALAMTVLEGDEGAPRDGHRPHGQGHVPEAA